MADSELTQLNIAKTEADKAVATALSAKSTAIEQLGQLESQKRNLLIAINRTQDEITFYNTKIGDPRWSDQIGSFLTKIDDLNRMLATQESSFTTYNIQIEQKNGEITNINDTIADARQSVEAATQNIANAIQSADPTSTIKTPEATNVGVNAPDNLISYSNPTNIQDIVQPLAGSYGFGISSQNFLNEFSSSGGSTVPPGAERVAEQPAKAQFRVKPDFRPRLLIPMMYIDSKQTSGPAPGVIKNSGGIVFPYTPAISQDYKANYASVTPQHSNYALYFYKNSSPSEISLSAKFTVQDDRDAHYFLSVIHILRSLIKMGFGTNDYNTGSPPPVCRLYAYGAYVFDNVPVALQSFSLKLDDNIDYFSLSSTSDGDLIKQIFSGANMVPVLSTISMSFIPMYSRREMMNGGVKNWLNGTSRTDGLL